MLNKLNRIERWQIPDSAITNKLIDRINVLSKITASNGITLTTSPMGINLIGPGAGDVRQQRKIFEVRSAATGDGVYNCYEQVLDSTDWTDTDGADKFNDKYSAWSNTTAYVIGIHVTNDDVQYRCILAHTNKEPGTAGDWETYWAAEAQVMNLRESNPISTYTPALCLYDRIDAWQITDDEENSRWVGIPVGPVLRFVYAVDSAPSSAVNTTSITCDVWLESEANAVSGQLGYHIEVYGRSAPLVSNWDAVFPVISAGCYYFAFCKNGSWYFSDIFMSNIPCTCVAP